MNIEALEAIVGAPVRLEELKHKPGRRRTARAHGPKGTALVKVYASARAPVVADRLRALAEGPEEPLVPTVLHAGHDHVVLSDLPGDPLRQALLEGDLATCARSGRALGAWHLAWSGASPSALRGHTADRELELLCGRAQAASTPVARAVADALPRLTGDWTCSTVVHRDLYEEQVLVGERVALIDLDDAALGPPELDLGNLLAHVELLELRRGRDLADGRFVLRAAYEDTGPALNGALLDRCRRLTLLRLACLNDDPRLVESALEEGALA